MEEFKLYIEYQGWLNKNGEYMTKETGRKAKLIRKPNGEQIISLHGGGEGAIDATKSIFWSEPILIKRWL